jgi:hypothetical protein
MSKGIRNFSIPLWNFSLFHALFLFKHSITYLSITHCHNRVLSRL